MPLSDLAKVTISPTNPGVTQAGFGVPLILGHPSWVERIRVYEDIEGVGTDFAVNTPEYMAAAKLFSQTPTVEKIKIGRGALKPTQRFVIGVKSVANSTVYKFRVAIKNGSAWTSQDVSITSDSSATNDEIISALQTAFDALAAPAVSGIGGTLMTSSIIGSSGSHELQLVANTAGEFFGVQVYDIARLTMRQDHADPGVATDLAAIALEDDDWYGLITLFNSEAYIKAAAGWVETSEKVYPAATQDSKVATDTENGSATDVAHDLKASAYARTAPFYHPSNDEFPDAAEMGRFFPIAPGGENWRYKTLSGVTAQSYTATQKTNIKAKYCNFYYVFGGVNVIGGDGKVSANEYIDVIRGRDWDAARRAERLSNLLIQAEKVPMTDEGISLVEQEMRAQSDEGIDAKFIASDPAPTVRVPKASAISSADRGNRKLTGVRVSYRLAGAINEIDVQVQVNV